MKTISILQPTERDWRSKQWLPQIATKQFTVDNAGVISAPSVKTYKKHWYTSAEVFSFESFSNLLSQLEQDKNSFIINGELIDGIDTSVPIDKRKHEQNGKPPTFKESNLVFFGVDVDKIPLAKLGYSENIFNVNHAEVFSTIIAKYLPEMVNVKCHFQLSSSAGLTSSDKISGHLFWYLDGENITNAEAKAYSLFVNKRCLKELGQKLLDTSVNQAVQPFYTSKPVLAAGIKEPFEARSGVIHGENDNLNSGKLLNIPVDQLQLTPARAGQPAKKTTKAPVQHVKLRNLVSSHEFSYNSIEEFLEAFKNVDEGLHQTSLSFWNWVFSQWWYGLPEKHPEQIFIDAINNSPRAKKDPARITKFFQEEWEKHKRTGKAHQRLIASHKHLETLIDANVTIKKKWFTYELTTDTLLIDSCLGTGKTQFTADLINSKPKVYKKILFLMARRNLAKNLVTRFSQVGIDVFDYEKVKEHLKHNLPQLNYDKVSCCINSLTQIADGNEVFDLVVIDELMFLIKSIHSKMFTEKERSHLLFVLWKIVKNAKKVIGLQGFLTPLAKEFFERCGRTEIDIVRNSYQRFQGLPCIMYKEDIELLGVLEKKLEKGEKVLVPCTTSGRAKSIYLYLSNKFPNKNFLLVESDEFTTDKPYATKFIAEPDKQAIKYDAIIYSPSIDVGISIDVPWFTSVVGFCDVFEGVGSPSTFIQQSFRSRPVKELHVWINPKKQALETNYNVLIAQAREVFKVAIEIVKNDAGEDVGQFKITDEMVEWAKARAEENKQRNNTIGELYGCFVDMQLDIKEFSPDKKLVSIGQAAADAGKELLKSNYISNVSAANQITQATAEKIRRQIDCTTGELWSCERFKMESCLVVDLDNLSKDEQDSEFAYWNQGQFKFHLDKLSIGLMDKKDAKQLAKKHVKSIINGLEKDLKFIIRYQVLNPLLKAVGVSVVNGELVLAPRAFYYNDLLQMPFVKWINRNIEAVNGAHLGAKLSKNGVTSRILGIWLRACGLSFTSMKKKCPEQAIISKEKKASSGHKKTRILQYNLDVTSDKAKFLFQKTRLRLENNTLFPTVIDTTDEITQIYEQLDKRPKANTSDTNDFKLTRKDFPSASSWNEYLEWQNSL